jgi:hypothetical protein
MRELRGRGGSCIPEGLENGFRVEQWDCGGQNGDFLLF